MTGNASLQGRGEESFRPHVLLQPIPVTPRGVDLPQDDVGLALAYIRKLVADAGPSRAARAFDDT